MSWLWLTGIVILALAVWLFVASRPKQVVATPPAKSSNPAPEPVPVVVNVPAAPPLVAPTSP